MSEADRSKKINAARRLLKERQKRKDVPSYTPVSDANSRRSSNGSTPTPENTPICNNGFNQDAHQSFPMPYNTQSHVNGSTNVVQECAPNSTNKYFDSTQPEKPMNETVAVNPETNSPHYFHVGTDRTDSSCSISTKSEEDYTPRVNYGQRQSLVDVGIREETSPSVSEYREKIHFLEGKLRELTDQSSINVEPSTEKLNIQQRTIEILVSEKTELQKELALITEDNKRNSEKCVEYSVKMKALKSEVARLQTEARDSNEARQQHNSILKRLEHSLNEANSSVEQYKRDLEINYEEIEELKKIIRDRDQKTEDFKKALDETNRKLSLAEMKLAQCGDNVNESQAALSGNFQVECEQLREEVVRMRREVSENTFQYKNYIENLNAQLQQVNNQYEICLKEKNDLIARQEGLSKQMSDMEKQIAKEKLAGPSLSESNLQLNQQLVAALQTVEELKSQLDEKTKLHDELLSRVESTSVKLNEAELALERLDVPNTQLLQAAMESDKIAASRAIEQNGLLKQQLNELTAEMNHSIIKLNNEKLELTEKLQHAEYLMREMKGKLHKYGHREEITYTDSVTQCPMIFQRNDSTQTDINDVEIFVDPQHATPEAMELLEKKLRKTMDQVVFLSDENQKLEHIVIQLQGETETIGEYVALYQNQRGLLMEKIMEREKQTALLAKERKELRDKLSEITNLLPQLPVKNHVIPGENINCGSNENVTDKIKYLLNEIESSELMTNKVDVIPSTFHPCLLCSGKLLTV